jgi:hypothetical protein
MAITRRAELERDALPRLIARVRAGRDYCAAARWKPVLFAMFGLVH